MAPFHIERGMALVCPIRRTCRRETEGLPPPILLAELIQLNGGEPQQVMLVEQRRNRREVQRVGKAGALGGRLRCGDRRSRCGVVAEQSSDLGPGQASDLDVAVLRAQIAYLWRSDVGGD